MEHYPLSHSRPSSRPVVYAANGMVCTGQPLAAQAGLRVLMRGGNAVDAAVATAAALTVVEPTANGIGGDAFALVWKDGRLYGLNASGPAPAALSLDTLRALHAARARRTSTAPVTQDPPAIDPHGWESVTVPGAPAGWAALSERFGALPFADLLEDAIRYASDGFPVSPVCARYWARAAERYRAAAAGLLEEWFRVFTFPGSLPDSFVSAGRAPEAGEIWRSPDHATTLEEIARTRAASLSLAGKRILEEVHVPTLFPDVLGDSIGLLPRLGTVRVQAPLRGVVYAVGEDEDRLPAL